MPVMQGQIDTVEDDFWTEHRELFTAQFPSYYTKPQKVRGRFHTSEEKYSASAHELIPISEKQGNRVGLYIKPKHYADQEAEIGKTIGQPKQQGFREAQVGNSQAWYY